MGLEEPFMKSLGVRLPLCTQIDEDTDRDRYMSPLEAKQYGLIDQVIGGDDAGFKVGLLSQRVQRSRASCAECDISVLRAALAG